MSALSTSRRKQAKGRKLAIAMLRKIEQDCTGSGVLGKGNYCIFDWFIDDDGSYRPCRDGPQDNIVARATLQLNGDPDLIAGFGSILTDYVASCHDGGTPSAAGYSDAWWRRRMRRIAHADAKETGA